MATQNPIEQEGTYPLPEAQIDRFLFKLLVDYPSPRRNRDDAAWGQVTTQPQLLAVSSGEELLALRDGGRPLHVADGRGLHSPLVRATRDLATPHERDEPG